MKEGTQRNSEFKPHADVGQADAHTVFKIGGYSNRMQADQDAKQFMMPTVFRNRSAIFPDPNNFRLRIEAVSVEVHAWEKPPSPSNTMYIELTLNLWGDEKDMQAWVSRVDRATKGYMPTSYGDTGDRMKHLRDRGQDSPLRRGVAAPVEGIGAGGDRDKHLADTGRGAYPKEGAQRDAEHEDEVNPAPEEAAD